VTSGGGPDDRVPASFGVPAGVRVVVFDVVGTLVEPDPPVADAYRAAAARHGVVVDPGEIRRRFTAAWRRQERADAAASPAYATSRGREAGRWRAIVAEVFGDVPAAGAIFADLWDHFARPEAWRPTGAGPELMRAAIESGVVVALASNFDERLLPIAAAVEPLRRARHVYVSSEIGWRKPAPEFFRWIESRLSARPGEILLVGDDPDADIAAARRAGWHVFDVAAGGGRREVPDGFSPDRPAGDPTR
jgi:putative hydrolase of the HAD superfamily